MRQSLPLALQILQWIDFSSSFESGIDNLMRSLAIIDTEERRIFATKQAEAEATLQALAEHDARVRVATDAIVQEHIDALAKQRIAEILEERAREEAEERSQRDLEQAEAERKSSTAETAARLSFFHTTGGLGAFCLLSGLGAIIVFYLHSWQFGVAAVGLAAAVGYVIRYRFTIPLIAMICISLVSVALVCALTVLTPSLNFNEVQTTHVIIDRPIWISHQLNSALITGLISGLAWISAAWDTNKDTFIKQFMKDSTGALQTSTRLAPGVYFTLLLFLPGLPISCGIYWSIAALLATLFSWGFGFGIDLNLVLFIWLPAASALGFGVMEILQASFFSPLRQDTSVRTATQ